MDGRFEFGEPGVIFSGGQGALDKGPPPTSECRKRSADSAKSGAVTLDRGLTAHSR